MWKALKWKNENSQRLKSNKKEKIRENNIVGGNMIEEKNFPIFIFNLALPRKCHKFCKWKPSDWKVLVFLLCICQLWLCLRDDVWAGWLNDFSLCWKYLDQRNVSILTRIEIRNFVFFILFTDWMEIGGKYVK